MMTCGSNIPNGSQPNGKSPTCDSYEARLLALLDGLTEREPKKSPGDPSRSADRMTVCIKQQTIERGMEAKFSKLPTKGLGR